MNILEIRDLKKTFKDVQAVNGLSVSISKGDIHGILGPNGAGKSTTINCMLGLVAPDSGKISFEGGRTLKQWKNNIGYIPQELAIYEEMTAEENIRFFCSLYGFNSSDLKAKTDNALEFAGLTEVRDKRAGTFSGGMKRRLNLACGIAHDPKLIIMDEPTVGIDPQSRNKIMENVKKLNERGATVIYTTHYMPEVEEICNKITVIDHGRVIADGTKLDIMNTLGKHTTLSVTFKNADSGLDRFIRNMSEVEGVSDVTAEDNVVMIRYDESYPIFEQLISNASDGLVISNITLEEPSLENIFLALTGKDTRD